MAEEPRARHGQLFTAGDKEFYRHARRCKRDRHQALNLCTGNMIEDTHYKTGFMGVPPDFDEDASTSMTR